MRLLLTIIAALWLSPAGAQQLSGGVRTGASSWTNLQDGTCFFSNSSSNGSTWDKEIFIRMKYSRNVALEASLGHYSYQGRYQSAGLPEVQLPDYQYQGVSERSQNVELNLSLQYRLSCPALEAKCPLMKKLDSYLGLVLTPTFSRTSLDNRYVNESNAASYVSSSVESEFSLWTGVSHTLIYQVSPQFYLSSSARFQVDPNSIFDQTSAFKARNGRIGLQVGIGYVFH